MTYCRLHFNDAGLVYKGSILFLISAVLVDWLVWAPFLVLERVDLADLFPGPEPPPEGKEPLVLHGEWGPAPPHQPGVGLHHRQAQRCHPLHVTVTVTRDHLDTEHFTMNTVDVLLTYSLPFKTWLPESSFLVQPEPFFSGSGPKSYSTVKHVIFTGNLFNLYFEFILIF